MSGRDAVGQSLSLALPAVTANRGGFCRRLSDPLGTGSGGGLSNKTGVHESLVAARTDWDSIALPIELAAHTIWNQQHCLIVPSTPTKPNRARIRTPMGASLGSSPPAA